MSRPPFRFTALPSELRGAIGTQLDLQSLARLKTAGHSTDRGNANSEPLLANNSIDPLLAEALVDPATRQATLVARENANPFAPSAIAELRKLRNSQHREQLESKIEAMPTGSDAQGRAKALQQIREFAQIQNTSLAQRVELLGGPEDPKILTPMQRLALATDPETDYAIRSRLMRNNAASVDELIAIVDGRRPYAFDPNGEIARALGETNSTWVERDLASRVDSASAADRKTFVDNPRTPKAVLEKILETSKQNPQQNAVLLKILAHPKTGRDLLVKIAWKALSAKALRVRAAIIAHPKLDEEALERVARNSADTGERAAIRSKALELRTSRNNAGQDNSGVYYRNNPLAALAHNAIDSEERQFLYTACNDDSAVLGALAEREKDPEVRQQLMTHPLCDDRLLAGLAVSAKTEDEFLQLLEHPKLGEHTLRALGPNLPFYNLRMRALGHPKMLAGELVSFAEHAVSDAERKTILAHPKCSTEALTQLARSALTPKQRLEIIKHPVVRTVNLLPLAKTSSDPAERALLQAHPYAKKQVQDQLTILACAQLTQAIAVVKNTATPEKELNNKAKNAKHALERLALAQNRSTSTIALDSLAAKAYYPTERLAIAKHPNSTAKAFGGLLRYPLYMEELKAITAHANVDIDTLQVILDRVTTRRDKTYVERRINEVIAEKAAADVEHAQPMEQH